MSGWVLVVWLLFPNNTVNLQPTSPARISLHATESDCQDARTVWLKEAGEHFSKAVCVPGR